MEILPRSKSFFPAELATLKENAEDIIFDFVIIANTILKTYQGYLNFYEAEELESKLELCKNLCPNKLQYKNRIYITSDINFISLMMVNVDDAVKENIIYTCDTEDDHCDSDVERIYTPCIWVFENNRLLKNKSLSSKIAIELCSVFYKENLVNYGSGFRDFWYAKPRKEVR